VPFIALNKFGIRRNSLNLEPSEYRFVYMCPECGTKMTFVNCSNRLRHFRHLVNNTCLWEPESTDHIELKHYIYDSLLRTGFFVEYEWKIGSGIADVAVFTGDKTIAIECQVSPISKQDLRERTENYIKLGAIPVWILHPKHFLRLCKVDMDTRVSYYRLKLVGDEFVYYDPQGYLKKPFFEAKWSENRIITKEDYEIYIEAYSCKTIFSILDEGFIGSPVDLIMDICADNKITLLKESV
jgi:hypothetical protein